MSYDADGDGDFDVEDAKVLLGKCTDFNEILTRLFCMTDFGSLLCNDKLNGTNSRAWYFSCFCCNHFFKTT